MLLIRPHVLLGGVALTSMVLCGTALPAGAGNRTVRPVCNLVTDPGNDADATYGASLPVVGAINDPSLDIASIDVASNTNNLVAVMRVTKLVLGPLVDPYGQAWTVSFTVKGTVYSMRANYDPVSNLTADAFAVSAGSTRVMTNPKVVGDTSKNEIRMTLPLYAFAGTTKIPVGTRVTSLRGASARQLRIPAGTSGPTIDPVSRLKPTDVTTRGRDYVAGGPSCVAVPTAAAS